VISTFEKILFFLFFTINSGQPRQLVYEFDVKYVVYNGIFADGFMLPPVIFSPSEIPSPDLCGIWHTGWSSDHWAYVFHWPDLLSANSNTTVEWIQQMFRPRMVGKHRPTSPYFFRDKTVLLLDAASWHTSEKTITELEDKVKSYHIIPGGVGKWLDPLDQSFHSDMSKAYARLLRDHPGEWIRNIIEACYSPSTESIKGSWQHTGLLGGDPESLINGRIQEGYAATKDREADHTRYRSAFMGWARSVLRSTDDLMPGKYPDMIDKTMNTGKHWTHWVV
jgi:hypothetical protein